jgi:hypothetical protein
LVPDVAFSKVPPLAVTVKPRSIALSFNPEYLSVPPSMTMLVLSKKLDPKLPNHPQFVKSSVPPVVTVTTAAGFRDGGTGRIFGNGGNSGGAAGSAGGGGGAAGIDANGGAGGAGKVIVVVVAGKVSAAEYMEDATSSPGITAIY